MPSTTVIRVGMDARAYKLLPRLMNPFVMKIISKAVAGDMDAAIDGSVTRR